MPVTTVTFSTHATPDKRASLIHEFVEDCLGSDIRVQEFMLEHVWRGTLVGIAVVVSTGEPTVVIAIPGLMRNPMRAIPFHQIRMLELESTPTT